MDIKCNCCKITKPENCFTIHNKMPNGRNRTCKECHNKRLKDYREKNRTKYNENLNDWRHSNKSKVKEYNEPLKNKYTSTVGNKYVKQLLRKSVIPINEQTVEMKREQIKIIRTIKQLKNETS